ncbi:MAG: hypothetical protein KDD37_07295 [Bdellovibrionales bacterium]|nr:hypothetical protein [Bdellovibrionales bacterium]
MKNAIFVMLVLVGCVSAKAANDVSTELYVKDKRQALDLKLHNKSSKEIYCESIDINVNLVGDEFGESIGEITLIEGPLYFQPKEDIFLNDLGFQQISELRTPDTVAIISSARVSSKTCHEVDFADYCKYAKKGVEEQYTIDRLKRFAKTASCDSVEKNIGDKLKLDGQNIVSLKPLSYLKKLKRLSLRENQLQDVSLLASLVSLNEIDVSENPLKEIDTLVQLPNIKVVAANDTLVYYKGIDYNTYSLKKVYLRRTPYEEQISKP